MADRKPISKKLRFEVFKRDEFTCQYCGRKAPDVVLEVDHVDPVSNGGENSISNLTTACFDCNRGKRDTILKSTEDQYELECMADSIESEYFQKSRSFLSLRSRDDLKLLIKKYGVSVVYQSMMLCLNTYDQSWIVVNKLPIICKELSLNKE